MTLHVGHGIGGTPQGIGPIGDLAPPARPMHGRVVGLIPMLKFAGDVVGPLAQARTNARKNARDFNDTETTRIEGQAGGKTIHTGGPRGGGPKPFNVGMAGGGRTSTTSAQAAEDEAREARAKQAGRENRAAYTRWMGTSRRPPRQPWGGEPEAETPFSEEYEPKHMKKPPRKTMDTSNMRDWTP